MKVLKSEDTPSFRSKGLQWLSFIKYVGVGEDLYFNILLIRYDSHKLLVLVLITILLLVNLVRVCTFRFHKMAPG